MDRQRMAGDCEMVDQQTIDRIRYRCSTASVFETRISFATRDIVELLTALDETRRENERMQQTFNFQEHLYRQRNWSEQTFGPGPRPEGIVDHIIKELHEILAAPGDVSEWIDVVILALDGAWRAGYSPEEIIAALIAKQTKNEKRKWPDWRTAEPGKAIEHDRSALAAGEPKEDR